MLNVVYAPGSMACLQSPQIMTGATPIVRGITTEMTLGAIAGDIAMIHGERVMANHHAS